MSPRRRGATPDGELHGEVLDLLLVGWGGTFPMDSLAIFDLSERDICDLWQRNKTVLRAEARRRGLSGVWAEEHCDSGPAQRRREDERGSGDAD